MWTIVATAHRKLVFKLNKPYSLTDLGRRKCHSCSNLSNFMQCFSEIDQILFEITHEVYFNSDMLKRKVKHQDASNEPFIQESNNCSLFFQQTCFPSHANGTSFRNVPCQGIRSGSRISVTVADLRGTPLLCPPPQRTKIVSIFWGENWAVICWCPLLEGWRPLLWGILDPPLSQEGATSFPVLVPHPMKIKEKFGSK